MNERSMERCVCREPLLSIVIPVYNEERRIGGVLRELKRYLGASQIDAEVIVVDDGSTDATARIVSDSDLKNLVLRGYRENRGKGYAVRMGLDSSKGTYALFADADGATAWCEIGRFIALMENGSDVLIASRAVAESVLVQRQNVMRRLMGCVFRNLVRCMFLMAFADTQCGFKMFTRRAWERISPHCREEGFSFDVEMLYWAGRERLRVHEVGVTWTDQHDSKVTLWKGPAKMFIELIKLRCRTFVSGMHK